MQSSPQIRKRDRTGGGFTKYQTTIGETICLRAYAARLLIAR